MRTKKIALLVLVSLLVLVVSACNVGNDRDLTRGYNTPDGLAPYTYDNDRDNGILFNRDNRFNANRYGYMDNNGLDRFNANRFNDNRYRTNANEDAERMANLAAKIKGVDDATVVISGRNAYVGLDLEDQVQTRNSTAVESQVNRTLRKFANRYDIRITSDADTFGRLRDIGDGVRNGTPLDRYQTDFRDFDNRFRR